LGVVLVAAGQGVAQLGPGGGTAGRAAELTAPSCLQRSMLIAGSTPMVLLGGVIPLPPGRAILHQLSIWP
jgi:hypothetical protein